MREKSFKAFLKDVQKCEKLGIQLYNFHPGSALKGGNPAESIQFVTDYLNQVLQETKNVILVIENMAGQGFVLGSTFEQLAQMISLISDKSRIGVCLDTCHLYSAGYE
jgi:apurinic endonuclease APN1